MCDSGVLYELYQLPEPVFGWIGTFMWYAAETPTVPLPNENPYNFDRSYEISCLSVQGSTPLVKNTITYSFQLSPIEKNEFSVTFLTDPPASIYVICCCLSNRYFLRSDGFGLKLL